MVSIQVARLFFESNFENLKESSMKFKLSSNFEFFKSS